MSRAPLKIRVPRWRSRWMVLESWRVLHRLSDDCRFLCCSDMESDECRERCGIYARGHAVCGAEGLWAMPGIFSRLGLPRCKHCCRVLGVPAGDGAPYNDESLPKRAKAA